MTEEQFFSSLQNPYSSRTEASFLRLVKRRLAGTPISYLTGSKEFWSLPFEVSPAVLIPRPETEVLVGKVLELTSREKELILDIGTGSGNIAIALAKELPRARIFASDVSERALKVARRNASLQSVRQIEFVKSNLFSSFRGTGLGFDFIVSNPPYVSRESWEKLPSEIRDHEPRRALLAGESGLEMLGRIIRRAGAFLRPGGYLILEIGEGQREDVLALFGRHWTEIETAWDMVGKPRVITARKSEKKKRRRRCPPLA